MLFCWSTLSPQLVTMVCFADFRVCTTLRWGLAPSPPFVTPHTVLGGSPGDRLPSMSHLVQMARETASCPLFTKC